MHYFKFFGEIRYFAFDFFLLVNVALKSDNIIVLGQRLGEKLFESKKHEIFMLRRVTYNNNWLIQTPFSWTWNLKTFIMLSSLLSKFELHKIFVHMILWSFNLFISILLLINYWHLAFRGFSNEIIWFNLMRLFFWCFHGRMNFRRTFRLIFGTIFSFLKFFWLGSLFRFTKE